MQILVILGYVTLEFENVTLILDYEGPLSHRKNSFPVTAKVFYFEINNTLMLSIQVFVDFGKAGKKTNRGPVAQCP